MQDCLVYEIIIDIIMHELDLNINNLVMPESQKVPINKVERLRKDLINKAILEYGFLNFLVLLDGLKKQLAVLEKEYEDCASASFRIMLYASMCDNLARLIEQYYMPEIYAKSAIWLASPNLSYQKLVNTLTSPMYNDKTLLGLDSVDRTSTARQVALFAGAKREYKFLFPDLYASLKLREKTKLELSSLVSKLITRDELIRRYEYIMYVFFSLEENPKAEIIERLFQKVFVEIIQDFEKEKKSDLVENSGEYSQLSLFKS